MSLLLLILSLVGLLVLAVIVAYALTIFLTMLAFMSGKLLLKIPLIRECLSNGSLNPFYKKRDTSHNGDNQSWYAQYCEYLINNRKDLWWFSVWHIYKLRQPNGMSQNNSQKPNYYRKKECPLNLFPKVLNNEITQPSPEAHNDNLAQENSDVNQNGTIPA